MSQLPKIGDRLRYIRKSPSHSGVTVAGVTGIRRDNAIGLVIDGGGDGYPEHRCYDHSEAPDCICGDADNGMVQAMPPWIVVAWETDAAGLFYKACVDLDGEGTDWERVK